MSEIPQIRKFEHGETRFEYLYYPGPELTLVFMHATGFLPWLWHPIARKLTDRFTVVAPYFCDHHAPEPEDGGLHWKILAQDLSYLCTDLSLKNPCFVGHSMGGTVMTIAAGEFGIEPAGMILIEPIYLPEQAYGAPMTIEQHPLASRSIKRRNQWSSSGEVHEYLAGRSLFKSWDPEMIDLYITHGMRTDEYGLTLACHPRREAAFFMGGIHFNPWPLLPRIKCQVMYLEGEKSENRLYIDLKKAASLVPRGEYHQIPGAGHLIPMEQPGVVQRLIEKYFS
jgi:lipase